MKNSDTIGNRTRDLPASSAVPQPTALPRGLQDYWEEFQERGTDVGPEEAAQGFPESLISTLQQSLSVMDAFVSSLNPFRSNNCLV